jgi:hypothetical protein
LGKENMNEATRSSAPRHIAIFLWIPSMIFSSVVIIYFFALVVASMFISPNHDHPQATSDAALLKEMQRDIGTGVL